MAAALGNNYAGKEKVWAKAIKRALEKRSRVDQVEALDALAEKLLAKCDEADMGALKELGDRLDGKPAQTIDATVRGSLAELLGTIGQSTSDDPPLEG